MNKKFIITVDTESDNQWDTGKMQTTENANYIPRFQELCVKYGFKPVYLVDYSMSNDEFLVSYLKQCLINGNCEVGAHLHAWDTPPVHEIDNAKTGRPYLIEYPRDIMEKKLSVLTEHLEKTFGEKMYSHRAGRWAMNEYYYDLLINYGYKVDCSVTPGINWRKQMGAIGGGADYSKELNDLQLIKNVLLEVPMTVGTIRYQPISFGKGVISGCKDIYRFFVGKKVWMRPALYGCEEMISLVELMENNNVSYVEMMIHSSELMPGGSPYFLNQESIEKLYSSLEGLFIEMKNRGYSGYTLKELI